MTTTLELDGLAGEQMELQPRRTLPADAPLFTGRTEPVVHRRQAHRRSAHPPAAVAEQLVIDDALMGHGDDIDIAGHLALAMREVETALQVLHRKRANLQRVLRRMRG